MVPCRSFLQTSRNGTKFEVNGDFVTVVHETGLFKGA